MDISLQKIISSGVESLSSIFSSGSKTDSVIGIDIGSSAIKVVQLRKKGGRAVLETYGAIALGPYANTDVGQITNLPPTEIVKALIDVMKESNITTKTGIIAIPSSASLILTIALPGKVTEDQLSSIVPTEARKYIPVPITEVSLDWFMIPPPAESFEEENIYNANQTLGTQLTPKVEVLVVAIHNEILQNFQNIVKSIDLSSNSFELEIFSDIRASFNHDLAPVLLMDFGASKTKLSIVEAGIVRVYHVVNRGSAEITHNISVSLGISFSEAEKLKRQVGLDKNINAQVSEIIRLSTDYIFSDTASVVLAYEKKYNKNISKIIITGGGSLIKGLLPYITAAFHTEVVYSDPFAKTEAPAFLEPVLQVSGPEFSVALGLALRQLS